MGTTGTIDTGNAIVDVTTGMPHVLEANELPPGVQTIREKLDLGTTAATFDFSATPIKAARIIVTSDAAGVAEFVHAIAVCFDPPNSTVRDAWLAEATSLVAPTNRLLLKVGSETTFVFRDSVGTPTGIDYIGVKLDDLGGGTPTVRVVVVGVEL